MASDCYSVLSFLWLLSLSIFPFISSSPIPPTITIPITFSSKNPYQDYYQKLNHWASASLARALHIKSSQLSPAAAAGSSSSNTPLFPRGYGGYSVSLSFGTPPQTIPFVFDTGSNFVWFPCTSRYACKSCSVPSPSSKAIPVFIPKQSSSVKILGCLNEKCGWIHRRTHPKSRCQDCQQGHKANCSQICPPYLILYGSGSTGGIVLLDTLDFPHHKVPNFLVGCSLFSSRQPSGIVGFGRGSSSMPSQLGLEKFSYCSMSHKFDDTGRSTSLVMQVKPDYAGTSANSSHMYTPLLKNPVVAGKDALSVYYYVGLRKITVGGQKVRIPYKNLVPDASGNGGTIVDSGTTFTYLSDDVHKLVVSAFVQQVKGLPRDEFIESKIGLRPCFNLSGHTGDVSFPTMKLHFKGGAEMELPLANYFSLAGDTHVICLTMVTDGVLGQEGPSGPSIVLGNYQTQNFNLEFDLKNERFGFRPQICQ